MTKILLILSVIIVILLGLLGITYKQMRHQRDDAIRWENNYKESNESYSRIQLTLKEFKETATAKEDSLLKVLKIKPKQVEKIVYIENNYINNDTTEIELIPSDEDYMFSGDELIEDSMPKESQVKFKFLQSIDCVEIQGVVISEDINTKFYITSLKTQSRFYYTAYWERRQWEILGIKTKLFGKKQGELSITSSCGTNMVKEIDIIKKK